MAKKSNKSAQMEIVVKNKMQEYREHLKTFTNDLKQVALADGREQVSANTLLREAYHLIGVELNTFEGWQEKGAQVRKGQHAYMFWGAPTTNKAGIKFCPVRFLFAREQVVLPNE